MGTNKSFQAGDRIIYEREYIGVLISPVGAVGGLRWKVEWEDGAETPDTTFPQSRMIHANGGPASAAAGAARIKAQALREAAEAWLSGPAQDHDTFATRWLRERADTIDPHTERKN